MYICKGKIWTNIVYTTEEYEFLTGEKYPILYNRKRFFEAIIPTSLVRSKGIAEVLEIIVDSYIYSGGVVCNDEAYLIVLGHLPGFYVGDRNELEKLIDNPTKESIDKTIGKCRRVTKDELPTGKVYLINHSEKDEKG